MTIVLLGTVYLYVGAAVAVVFLLFGIGRIDENAQDAWVFRPLIIPGVLLIWPLVLWRWLREETGRIDSTARYAPPRKAHGIASVFLACLVVATLLTAFAIRQTWPSDMAPIQVAAPGDAE